MVFQRIFMTSLMGILLFVLGLFLLELRLGLFQIGVVFALFVFSRVFASLNMWVTLGTLILCYILMVLAGYFFLMWMKRGRVMHVFLMFVCAAGAMLTREEAYVLPLAVPLLWMLSARPWSAWRATLVAALGLLAIAGIHFALRNIFVPEVRQDPNLSFTLLKLKVSLISLASSWLPGGVSTIGLVDGVLAALWISFLIGLAVMLAALGGTRPRWRVVGTCVLGCVLALPSLGAPRPFGIAMSTLAFYAAVAMAIAEVSRRLAAVEYSRRWVYYASAVYLALGLGAGVIGGVRRSNYVAESLHPNCIPRIAVDAILVFNLRERYVPVPEERREAARSRFATLGIYNVPDLYRLYTESIEHPERYERDNQQTRTLFVPKYDYLSY
jgi:hypothetical protein